MMQEHNIYGVILAAGGSTRFKTGTSKLVADICGRKMILFPVLLLEKLNIPTTVVVGFQRDVVIDAITQQTTRPQFVVQEQQLGTGHALLCSQQHWSADNILLLNGDMPLISEEIITDLIERHTQANAGISFVVSHNTDASIGYGRLVEEDGVRRIVEAKHFTYNVDEYPLVNAGIYLINRSFLEQHLNEIEQNEVTNEFYVTDLIELASKNNIPAIAVEHPFDALYGVNTFKQLEKVERIKKREITDYWMARGVRFKNPKSVHIDLDVTIEPCAEIDTCVELRGKTHIGKKCKIGPFCVLEDTQVTDGVQIKSHCSLQNKTVNKHLKSYTHR